MKIMRWNNEPILSDFWNSFFENEINQPVYRRQFSAPAANILEQDGEYHLELAVPGLSKEDFKIDVENNLLTVSSEKELQNEENGKNFTRKEFVYGSFSRSFTLPKSIDTDNINASYQNGILHIMLPKKEEEKAKAKRLIAIE